MTNTDDMTDAINHYIRTDLMGRIIHGFSTAFETPQPDDILLHEGGYQFRLFPGGEENPRLFTAEGIPLYRWDGGEVIQRSREEIADEIAALPPPPVYTDPYKAAISMILSQSAEALTDAQALSVAEVFPLWTAGWTGSQGAIVRDGEHLYRSLHDVTNTAQNTRPSDTPAMWTMVGDPQEEFPAWIPPTGAHNAYIKGDKVSYQGNEWVSQVAGNVWEPGVYGWNMV